MKKGLNTESYRIWMNCLLVVMIAIAPAIAISSIWFCLHHFDIVVVKRAYVVVSLANGLLGGTYIFFLNNMFAEARKYYRKLNAFIESNRALFKRYSDYKKGRLDDKLDEEDIERLLDDVRGVRHDYLEFVHGKLSRYDHATMVVVSFFTMFSVFARQYEDAIEGVSFIFILTFVMTALFLMSRVMENPIQGSFRTKDIDLEWLRDEV